MLISRHVAAFLDRHLARKEFGMGAALHLVQRRAVGRLAHAGQPVTGISPDARKAIRSLRSDGFYVVPYFLSRAAAAQMAASLRKTLSENPQRLSGATLPYDKRLFGIEVFANEFRSFYDHPLLREVASEYVGNGTIPAFTLGAKLSPVPGNPGSGGGWHRDNLQPQFKAMIYLSDVSAASGPFQIIKRSHRLIHTIRDNELMHVSYKNPRISDACVEALLRSTGDARRLTFLAPAGTVVMFDSCAIHRGAPILSGERLALTNYYFQRGEIGRQLYEHFGIQDVYGPAGGGGR